MGRLSGAVVGVGLAAATLCIAPMAVHAQSAPTVFTFSFRLTIEGTPTHGDSFAVSWGETGIDMCNAPCLGDGHTYVQSMNFPAGVTETFVFTRVYGPVSPGHPGQQFARQTLTATRSQSVNATFTYGAAVPVPNSGADATPMIAVALVATGAGAGLMALHQRRRRCTSRRAAGS